MGQRLAQNNSVIGFLKFQKSDWRLWIFSSKQWRGYKNSIHDFHFLMHRWTIKRKHDRCSVLNRYLSILTNKNSNQRLPDFHNIHKLVTYGQAVQATGVTPFVWCQLTQKKNWMEKNIDKWTWAMLAGAIKG